MFGSNKEGLPMSSNGYALAKTPQAEDETVKCNPEGVRVSPELDEVLHLLEALQRRRSNGNPQTG